MSTGNARGRRGGRGVVLYMRVYAIVIHIAYLCASDSQSQIENYIIPKAAPNALSLSSYDSQQL